MLSMDKLILEMKRKKSAICLGLDPFIEKIPAKFIEEGKSYFGPTLSGYSYAILQFNKTVLEICKDKIAVVKPQFSLYTRFGVDGILTFNNTINYAKELGIPVIIDAKSNDIESSMEGYVDGFLSRLTCFGSEYKSFDADFLTVNPYMGTDTFKPLKKAVEKYGKGAFVLVKTSNPSSKDFQDILVEEKPLYWHVSKKIRDYFAENKGDSGFLGVGIVVGATMPEELKILRKDFPDLFFLIPGYGAQGGTLESLKQIVVDNIGFIVNASRSILYSYLDRYSNLDFSEAITRSIDEMNDEINSIVKY